MKKKLILVSFALFWTILGGLSIQSVQADMLTPPHSSSESTSEIIDDKSVVENDSVEKENEKSALSVVDYGSQYFTNVSFTDISGNSLAKVSDSDKVKVNYRFSIPDDVHENETMSIQLPEQLQMVNYSDFPILDESGAVIANASTSKATELVTLTFTSNVENKTDINGALFFWAKFNKEKLVEGENVFSMPFKGVTTDLTLVVRKTLSTGTGTTNPTVIYKSGLFDKNDPSVINWTITVNNAHQNLLQPKVIDTIGEGQSLVSGSFAFNYRDENKKSLKKLTLPEGNEVEEGRTKLSLKTSGFIMILENLGSYSTNNHYYSAVVTYQTKVDPSVVRYINGAETVDEAGKPQKRSASVIDYGSGGIASGNTQQAIDNLSDVIDAATSVDLDVQPKEDAMKLVDATDAAQRILDDETSITEQLDGASNTLDDVVQEVTPSVEPPVDEELVKALQELQSRVDEIKAIDSSLYTETSWDTVQKALGESETLLSNEKENPGTATVDGVKESINNLNDALQGLVKKEVPPVDEGVSKLLKKLENLVNEAKAIDASLYTKSSWEAVEKALKEAEALLNSEKENPGSHDYVTVQFSIEKLNKSLDALIKKELPSSNKQNQVPPINNNMGGEDKGFRSNKGILPSTGDVSDYWLLLSGFALVILAALSSLRVRKLRK